MKPEDYMPILGEQTIRFVVREDGPVVGVFSKSIADYDNIMTVVGDTNGGGVENHHSLVQFYSTSDFKAGTELVFGLHVRTTGDTFYSNNSPDGYDHFSYQYNSTAHRLYVSSEDMMGGGDMDFDDLVASFSNVDMINLGEFV